MSVKVAVIGGGGARTPLLMHGLAEAQDILNIGELVLYDLAPKSAPLMAAMGREITAAAGFPVRAAATLEDAVEGAGFVLSSIRVGGIDARARDERIIIESGIAGQETTGPGGLAMALRTVPIALQHAALVEKLAPEAWLINFTNPAGLITQALARHSRTRVIGICDTPSELFHRIAWALGEPFEEMEFLYSGLNHLGWVSDVLLRGKSVMPRLLADDDALLRLYPARLFEPAMIRALGLIPTEYLFFVYGRSRALANQQAAGASRGEEIKEMNRRLFADIEKKVAAQQVSEAVQVYKNYLNQRNASYMKLEAEAGSGLIDETHDWDPFAGATGYHRIALDVMTALSGSDPKTVVVNVRNEKTVPSLLATDIVEVPSVIDRNGPRPLPVGQLPPSIEGLVLAVKQYERLAIEAAISGSQAMAQLALMIYPIVGEWEPAVRVLDRLIAADPEHLGYLT